MKSFGYFKQKEKTLKFAWQNFEAQSSLGVKINFDPMVKWRGLDKTNVHIVHINYSFSMAIKPHVCDSWNIRKQK